MQTTPGGFKLLEGGDYVPAAFYAEDGAFNVNTQLTEVRLDNLDEEKADKSMVKTGTLVSTGWAGSSAPYTQAVDIDGVAADSNGTAGLAPTATAAQMEAAADAKLLVTAQAAGSITVSAFGDKPTIDLPIQVLIVG
jgi:hypothetical protein